MTWLIIPLALFLLLAAFLVLYLAKRQQRTSGLPAGRIISSDTGHWDQVERPLYDPISGLTGKPDYLVELDDGETLVPVEVKSGRAPAVPFDSHVFQLAAYCLLVERAYGQRPPFGILRYRDRTFSIDFTPALEQELEDMLAEIRQQEKRGEASRSHNEPARCARCGYRKICNQRL